MKTVTLTLEVRDLFTIHDLFICPQVVSANYVRPAWDTYSDQDQALALLCVAHYPQGKISAIKVFRQCSGWSLREAKEIIDTAFTRPPQ